jgi:hypothetical protein
VHAGRPAGNALGFRCRWVQAAGPNPPFLFLKEMADAFTAVAYPFRVSTSTLTEQSSCKGAKRQRRQSPGAAPGRFIRDGSWGTFEAALADYC